MAATLQSLSPARQHDLHHEQRQPKFPIRQTAPLRIGISGKAQQAYGANRCRGSGGPTKDRNMSTQVVLITGGLTGIGRAAAVAFARKGAKVVVAGRRDEAGKALVKEL